MGKVIFVHGYELKEKLINTITHKKKQGIRWKKLRKMYQKYV